MSINKFFIILIFIVQGLLIYSETSIDPYSLEKDKKRLRIEYSFYKNISSGIKPIIFVSVNNKFYLLYETSIILNQNNFYRRVFNNKNVRSEMPILTETIEEELPKNKFISVYLEMEEGKIYYRIPQKYVIDTPFGDRMVKIKEIALAAQYCHNFFIVLVNDELRLYDVGKCFKMGE